MGTFLHKSSPARRPGLAFFVAGLVAANLFLLSSLEAPGGTALGTACPVPPFSFVSGLRDAPGAVASPIATARRGLVPCANAASPLPFQRSPAP